jgi:O-antigen/teichoic acid export membrane protein
MKLSDQAAALFLSKTVTAGLVFILGPILVRYLTQAEYGTFLQVNLLTTFVVTAAPIGLSQSFAYFVPRLGTGKHYQFVVRTLTLLAGMGIIGAVAIFVGRNYLGDWMNNANLAMLAPYIGALIVATIISDTTETIFLSEKRGSLVATILPIKAVARLAAILIPLLTGAGLTGVFLGLSAALFSEAAILYGYYVIKCRSHKPNPEAVELKEQFTYCLPIGAALVVASVGGSVDMFVVMPSMQGEHSICRWWVLSQRCCLICWRRGLSSNGLRGRKKKLPGFCGNLFDVSPSFFTQLCASPLSWPTRSSHFSSRTITRPVSLSFVSTC